MRHDLALEPNAPTAGHDGRADRYSDCDAYDPRVDLDLGSAPVLIRVPRVCQARRPSPAACRRLRSHAASTHGRIGPGLTAPRRRRLRREVRLAGWAVMSALPLTLAALLLRGAAAPALASALPPEAPVTITIERPAAARHMVPSVVFPGYLLPDDGAEEARHAGG